MRPIARLVRRKRAPLSHHHRVSWPPLRPWVLLLACLGGAVARAGVDVPIVVAQLPIGTPAEAGGSRAGGMLRADYGNGARLVLLEPDGTSRVLSEGFQSAGDPCVAFDGRRLLFAGKRQAGDPWNVFEMSLDGAPPRQVTRDLGNCRSPIYLSTFYTITETEPWEQIAFVSDRSGWRDEQGGGPATALYTCKPDGSFVQRITWNASSDDDPRILADGRLIYASWHRANLDRGPLGRIALEGVNVDGLDRGPFVEASARRIQHMPCVTTRGRIVFVESDALPWDGSGTLGGVSLRRPLHTYRALTTPTDGLFHSPSPLPDGRILVARRPADGTGSLGLVALDPDTQQVEPICDDPKFHEMQAQAMWDRPRPDGRSSVVSEHDPLAKLYGLDVHITDLKDPSWLPPGTIRAIRIVEGVPRTAATPGRAPANAPPLTPRRILAEVPIESDGSFQAVVPANTPIQLQALDEHGLAVRSCGWVWARSHQAQGCIGCHEDPERTPPNGYAQALGKPAAMAHPAVEARVAVDFVHDVAPLVASHCNGCHGPGGSPPQLVGEGASLAPQAVYDALLAPSPGAPPGETTSGRYVHPGSARTSPLVWHLLGRNTARPWDGAIAARPARAIPGDTTGTLPLGRAETQTFVRWIDLGAAWDRLAPPSDRPASAR